MKKKKARMRRIMVAMPPEMFEDFRLKAEMSGLSISRVIYLRLRTRGPMVVVPPEVLKEVKMLTAIYGRILATGNLAESDRAYLRGILEFEAKLVDLEARPAIVHGRQVRHGG